MDSHTRKRLSGRLMLVISLPIVVFSVLFILALVSVETSHSFIVRLYEKDLRELIELGSSSVERMWVLPRNHAVMNLARSPSLVGLLEGRTARSTLLGEWEAVRSSMTDVAFIGFGFSNGSFDQFPSTAFPEGFRPFSSPWYVTGMDLPRGVAWTRPYADPVSGDTVVCTVTPIKDADDGLDGVLTVATTLEALEDLLNGIRMPERGVVLILDQGGAVFCGTDSEFLGLTALPVATPDRVVETGPMLSNGWRLAYIIPRESITAQFSELRSTVLFFSLAVIAISACALIGLVGGLVSRMSTLSGYFTQVVSVERPLQELFRSKDEFSNLNRVFNSVISRIRSAEEEKLARERTYRHLLERAPAGFFRAAKDGTFLLMNDRFAEIFGKSKDELLSGGSISSLCADPAEAGNLLAELTSGDEVRDFRTACTGKNGGRLWISFNTVLNEGRGAPGEPLVEGFVTDVTDQMKEEELLRRAAETDGLTGLANRRFFESELARLCGDASRNGGPLSLLLMDVDFFKTFNDTYGHDVGDRVLKAIASTGKTVLRQRDLFARIGGDEFSVILPGTHENAALALANRFINALTESGECADLPKRPTVSIGAAEIDPAHFDGPSLFKKTDDALYRAKEAGRNCAAGTAETAHA